MITQIPLTLLKTTNKKRMRANGSNNIAFRASYVNNNMLLFGDGGSVVTKEQMKELNAQIDAANKAIIKMINEGKTNTDEYKNMLKQRAESEKQFEEAAASDITVTGNEDLKALSEEISEINNVITETINEIADGGITPEEMEDLNEKLNQYVSKSNEFREQWEKGSTGEKKEDPNARNDKGQEKTDKQNDAQVDEWRNSRGIDTADDNVIEETKDKRSEWWFNVYDVVPKESSNTIWDKIDKEKDNAVAQVENSPLAPTSFNASTGQTAANASTGEQTPKYTDAGIDAEMQDTEISDETFDPRLRRYDAFVTLNPNASDEGTLVIPLASETAASAYYDMVFTIEKDVNDVVMAQANKKTTETQSESTNATVNQQNNESNGGKASGGRRVAPSEQPAFGGHDVFGDESGHDIRQDPNMYGTASLINHYALTTLCGGLSGTRGKFKTHLYDIRNRRRFYDVSFSGNNTIGKMVETSDDYLSINNPTTTNIIRWSNKDKWGRTPYSFTDFLFCKYWNIIPNNRLITFRKYYAPTWDNLNFPGMQPQTNANKSESGGVNTFAPIATVVSYFGGDSGNSLSSFLSFTTGTKWKNVEAQIHNVDGETGSDGRAVVDKAFESGGFGGVGSNSNFINGILGSTGMLTGKYFSFGKFVGLLSPDGYNMNKDQATFEQLSKANVDPTDSLYSNKIVGPVNRITATQQRDAGLEFSQSFSLICEYIARPIGGVNTKAAMLEILANCLEIGSADAVWWGGGYRFNIHPSVYPFKNGAGKNSVMDKLYQGQIFGKTGAISQALEGFKTIGTKNSKTGTESAEFDWSNVLDNLGEVFSQTIGAIGNMLSDVGSALFGQSNSLSQLIDKGTDALSSEEQQKKGSEKAKNLFGNLNDMWRSQMIQQSVMPSINGMKAILTGEPVGTWHLTLGNPLNPIMVVGNLICKSMSVQFGDELGPDDFPIEMKVTYTIEHAMARDKGSIESMFNRGSGKIYKLPDYVRSSSDYESKVDAFTGRGSGNFYTPKYMSVGELKANGGSQGVGSASGWQTYKMAQPKQLAMAGNADTTFIPSFVPYDPDVTSGNVKPSKEMSSIFTISRANYHARKMSDN